MTQKLLFHDSLLNKNTIIIISAIFIIGLVILLLAVNYFPLPTFAYPFLSIMLVVPLVLLFMLFRIDIKANEQNITVVLGIGLIKSIIPYHAIEKGSIATIDVLSESTGVKKEGNNITYSMKDVFIATKFTTKSNNNYTIITNKAHELTKLLLEKVN